MHKLISLNVKWVVFLALVTLMFDSNASVAQESPAQTVVSGFITDQSNGQPLAGSNVVFLGDRSELFGGVSNDDGFYQVEVSGSSRYVFQVSYIGYAVYRDTLDLIDQAYVSINVVLNPTDEVIDEIFITSEREHGAARVSAGLQKIRPDDLQRIPTPGPSGDLATYLQTLPGVVTLGDRGGQLFIRGGTPSQNLILVDGMMIYNPFHILGFFSAFPEDLVADVDVYAGGFGAQYSGRMSSVIDVTMRGGNNQRVEGAVAVSPFLSDIRLEGPIQRGKTSLIASLRLSTVEETAPTILGEQLPLNFNDWFVKLQHNAANSRCSASIMHTYDRGQIDPERGDSFKWANTLFGGQCVGSSPESSVYSKFNTSFSHFTNSIGIPDNPARKSSAWRINIDAEFLLPKGDVEYQWGFYGRADELVYDVQELFTGFRSDESFLMEVGGHIGVSLVLLENLHVNPSMAITLPFSYPAGLEPRLRLSWQPANDKQQEINAALGLYRQNFIGINDERDAGSVFTLWLPTPTDQKQANALHALLGWSRQFKFFDLSVEGYYKQLKNLPIPLWSTIAQFTTNLALADGNIHGVDIRLEYRFKRLYGYIGYGYAWIEYEATQENFGEWFGASVQRYNPPHDRRHQLNAVASLDFGRFNTSVRWQYGSGVPFTQPFGFDSLIFLPGLSERADIDYGTPRILYDRPYGGRLPSYHRLDFSAEYEATIGAVEFSLQAGVINVYGRKNLFYYDVFTLRRVDQLPITPYAGIKVAF